MNRSHSSQILLIQLRLVFPVEAINHRDCLASILQIETVALARQTTGNAGELFHICGSK